MFKLIFAYIIIVVICFNLNGVESSIESQSSIYTNKVKNAKHLLLNDIDKLLIEHVFHTRSVIETLTELKIKNMNSISDGIFNNLTNIMTVASEEINNLKELAVMKNVNIKMCDLHLDHFETLKQSVKTEIQTHLNYSISDLKNHLQNNSIINVYRYLVDLEHPNHYELYEQLLLCNNSIECVEKVNESGLKYNWLLDSFESRFKLLFSNDINELFSIHQVYFENAIQKEFTEALKVDEEIIKKCINTKL